MSASIAKTAFLRFIMGLALAATALTAPAHEGHDHGEPEPAPVASGAPRTAASTELFELVAVQNHGRLIIYLDRYADNSPVGGATVEVESGDWKAVAAAVGEGTYAVSAPRLDAPGRHPLTFTVVEGQNGDLMEATLIVNETATQTQPAERPTWLFAFLILPLLALFAVWRHRKPRAERRRIALESQS